ncbi:hypothetical protein Tco_0156322 [Tanacetum coccineum]
MGNEDIKPPMDGDNLVPIPRVFEKPLNPILETSNTTITVPLFDFDSEFSLNSDNPILDIQNKESDEFKTETIMEKDCPGIGYLLKDKNGVKTDKIGLEFGKNAKNQSRRSIHA